MAIETQAANIPPARIARRVGGDAYEGTSPIQKLLIGRRLTGEKRVHVNGEPS
jgi:hypothetical protein